MAIKSLIVENHCNQCHMPFSLRVNVGKDGDGVTVYKFLHRCYTPVDLMVLGMYLDDITPRDRKGGRKAPNGFQEVEASVSA